MLDVWVIGTWLIACLISVPLIIFCLEVLLGLKGLHSDVAPSDCGSACVLMPAHNEADVLGATLDDLLSVLPSSASILVIADNCDDRTAEIGRQRGVNVVERHDPENRGKGFALDCGRDWLRRSPPDCVIVLDADCRSDLNSLQGLINTALGFGVAVQASYTFDPDLTADPRVQISNFALWIKNVVRQKGTQKMGGAAVLTGTGMAFPWALFDDLHLATSHITEDLALAVDLIRKRKPPKFLESAHVRSRAAGKDATFAQRSRWEHGFLSVARDYSLPLLGRGFASFNRQMILLGLHLLVPPLALLISITGCIAAILSFVAIWKGILFPAIIVGLVLMAVVFCLLLAWLAGGRRWLSAKCLMMIPLYILWKLPVYVRFIRGERSGWNRTDRS